LSDEQDGVELYRYIIQPAPMRTLLVYMIYAIVRVETHKPSAALHPCDPKDRTCKSPNAANAWLHITPLLYNESILSGFYTRTLETQSSSSPLSSSSSFRFCSFRLRSPFLDLSSFSHSLFADSLFRSGKIRLKTSEYHSTGWPSIPSLMF